MLRFVIKTICYGFYAIALTLCLWWIIASTRSHTLKTEAHIVLCGNSTVEYGIDTREYPEVLNLGLNAEHMEYVYAKIKLLKRYNPQIDTLILSFDNAILFKGHTASHVSDLHHPYYYDQYTLSDIKYLLRNASLQWNESYLSRAFTPTKLSAPITSLLGKDITPSHLGIGEYAVLDRQMDATAKFCRSQDYPSLLDKDRDDSALACYFLDRVKEFCDSNGITLIFISTPLLYGDCKIKKYREVWREKYRDVPIYDYIDMNVPTICFADNMHLNYIGAKIFADTLMHDIRLKAELK